ncbi:DNA photolyase phr1 [Polyrhizophydium stewartii]|uniref:DNA photolyase phr1 n=1 Tax=Polyrhizophydium stewartii TaxID=2732419 RepID=A0ABR4NGF3_9FUNG|nr:hypothetical protein HK105_003058 [Polyrhizophydium stewartii]
MSARSSQKPAQAQQPLAAATPEKSQRKNKHASPTLSPESPTVGTAKRSRSTDASQATSLMWFRTDLRVFDNEALSKACAAGRPVVALFVIAKGEWKHHDFAPIKVDFVLRNLRTLAQSLAKLNIPLVVRTADAVKDVRPVVLDVVSQIGAKKVFWNKELEIDESRRDARIAEDLTAAGVTVSVNNSQMVVLPDLVFTKDRSPYTVYTPYKNCWISVVDASPNLLDLIPVPDPVAAALPEIVANYAKEHSEIPDALDEFPMPDELRKRAHAEWPAGERVAHERLVTFLEQRGARYKDERDFPAKPSTSRLSTYQASGVISSKLCVRLAWEANHKRLATGQPGLVHWISEVVWREFYRYILVKFPRVCMNKPFKLETDRVAWSYDKEKFESWCEGKTGYPIVDAAMRQLNTTGWMHNRLRMIAASFLTKDLLIDWRWGEKYFMQNLIDGDFASNNGGWQWTASTGTDSQPYFRIFNPLLQSEKFDPEGVLIREFVPELAGLSNDVIHEPSRKLSSKQLARIGYPEPMVDHGAARNKCIAEFKRASGK